MPNIHTAQEMNTPKPNNATHRADVSIVKGLAIILMVIGHSAPPQSLFTFIYSFHMPLFFFTAGYMFKHKYIHDKRTFIWRRIKGIYWPFLKWCLLFLALHNVLSSFNIYNDYYSLQETLHNALRSVFFLDTELLLSGYWFLKDLFIAGIGSMFIFSIIHKACNSCKKLKGKELFLIYATIVFFIFLATIEFLPPNRIFNIKTIKAFLFFITGYAFRLSNIKLNCSTGIVLVLIVLIETQTFLAEENTSITSHGTLAIIGFFNATIATIGLLSIAPHLSKKVAKFLDYTGTKTFIILTWHFVALKLISVVKILVLDLPWASLSEFPVIHKDNSFFWIIYAIGGVSLPLLATFALSRIGAKVQNGQ